MHPHALIPSAVIGFASGLRSTMGVAAYAHTHVGGTWLGGLAGAAIVGEAVVDKLPGTPSRLQLPALLARPAAGAIGAYGLIGHAGRDTLLAGTVIGSVAALAGSYAGAACRGAAARRIPPIAAALAEDAIALGLAYVAVRSAGR